MRYLPLLWAGLWRKPLRSILTMLSIMVAFLLFGVLQGIDSGFNDVLARSRLDRLMVDGRFPGGPPMPSAYRRQIEAVPGVTVVTQRFGFGGYYQDPKNRMGITLTDANFLAVRPELKVTADHLAAWEATPTGVLVSDYQAARYGWKVGDRIPLQSQMPNRDGSRTWTFDIMGLITDTMQPEATWILGHYGFGDEARTNNQGTADRFLLRIADPRQSVEVGHAIDALFANSPVPTRTMSEQAQAESRSQLLVDASLIVNAITAAVFFMLLFITSNTMMQSVRERIPEFAVLKTVGFSDGAVLALVIAEAMALILVAALAGLGLSALLPPLIRSIFNLPALRLSVVLFGMAMAVLVAGISGGPPAWKARRLSVIDALAGRR